MELPPGGDRRFRKRKQIEMLNSKYRVINERRGYL